MDNKLCHMGWKEALSKAFQIFWQVFFTGFASVLSKVQIKTQVISINVIQIGFYSLFLHIILISVLWKINLMLNPQGGWESVFILRSFRILNRLKCIVNLQEEGLASSMPQWYGTMNPLCSEYSVNSPELNSCKCSFKGAFLYQEM